MKLPALSSPPPHDLALTHTSNGDPTHKLDIIQNGSQDKILEPYTPAEHRTSKLTSSSGALTHLLKASLGSGVLAMPLAFKNAGLAVGAVGTVLVGVICTHSLHVLVKTSQEVCVETRTPALGYAETCYRVFQTGPPATRWLASFASGVADWALAATHMGACCVYVVLMAESFHQVSKEYGGPNLSLQEFCVMSLVPLVPLTQIRKLKYLVPFSALANLAWCASIVISLYYCFTDTPSVQQRSATSSIENLPLFICNALFAMEGVGIVMHVENEMSKPQQFLGCPGVLNIAMSFVVLLYGFVGFSGYLKYGEDVRGSLTLNLPRDEIMAQTAKIMVALVLMLSYGLIYYVPVDVVWRRIESKISKSRQTICMCILRLFGVLLTVALAVATPRLELFMELVGAICLSVLGLLLPAVIDTTWRWNRGYGTGLWILWKNVAISLLALLTLCFGSFYAVKGLVEYLYR